MRQLPAGALNTLADYKYSHYFVELAPGYTYDDLFSPVFWSHHPKLKKFDTIRVVAHDWSFDVTVTVTAKTKGGAHVQLTPVLPPESAAPSVQVVPHLRNGKLAIRVEFLPVTKWRVIALDQSEHSRNWETKAEAEGVMAQYLKELGMVLPSEDLGEDDDEELERMTAPEKAA